MTLQPKLDGKVHFSVEFRGINALHKKYTYPLSWLNDSVNEIDAATHITNVDLVKDYLLYSCQRGPSRWPTLWPMEWCTSAK